MKSRETPQNPNFCNGQIIPHFRFSPNYLLLTYLTFQVAFYFANTYMCYYENLQF